MVGLIGSGGMVCSGLVFYGWLVFLVVLSRLVECMVVGWLVGWLWVG